MFEFVAETYTPRQKQKTAVSRVRGVSLAADQLCAEGTEVRLIHSPRECVVLGFTISQAIADAHRFEHCVAAARQSESEGVCR